MLSAQKYGKNLHVNYSPFGAILYGRNWSSEKYRYGFNGMEKDDEVKGAGNSYDYVNRFYDPRLGRFLSIDYITKAYESPYIYAANNPILFVDYNGGDNVIYLVLLPSAKEVLSPDNAQEIAAKANEMYKSLGLNTRVKVFIGDDFNTEFLDKNDSYAMVGSLEDIRLTTANFSSWNPKETLDGFRGGLKNPERSMSGGNNWTVPAKGIFIDAYAINGFAKIINQDKSATVALTILHGSTHNSGMGDHSYFGINMAMVYFMARLNPQGMEPNSIYLDDDNQPVSPPDRADELMDLFDKETNSKVIEFNLRTFGSGSGQTYLNASYGEKLTGGLFQLIIIPEIRQKVKQE